MSEAYKALIRHHWEQVAATTGQPFNYDFFKREGFVLDTEPACRASVTVRRLAPERLLSFYERIHKGYYLADSDTTAPETFTEYARAEGLDPEAFGEAFASEAIRQETIEDFAWCQRAGVSGFPTVVLREDDAIAALTVGFQPSDLLEPVR